MDYTKALKDEKLPPGSVVTLPPVGVVLDLEIARAKFKPYQNRLDEIKDQVGFLVVNNDATNKEATEIAAILAGVLKKLDFARLNTIAEAHDFTTSVNTFVRGISSQLKALVKALKGQIGEYGDVVVEFERRKKQKEAQDAAKKDQKKMDLVAEKIGVPSPQLPKPVLPKQQDPVRTATGSSTTKLEWTFEIEDPAKVPNKYKMVDEAKLKAALKAGIRNIAGVRIFKAPKVSIRT